MTSLLPAGLAAILVACSDTPAGDPGVQPGGDAGAVSDGAARDRSDAGSGADGGPSPDPCAGATGLVIDKALALGRTSLRPGDTLSGTVRYRNCGSTPLSVKDIVITSRPPNGTHANGPYDDFTPTQGPTTFAPGQTVTLTASRALATSDPTGSWISYATYQDAASAWHDGPDVGFTVQAQLGSDGGLDGGVVGSNPQNPIDNYTADKTFTLNSGKSDYYVSIPASYDRTHKTPMTLFVWLHGCGGQGLYDADMVSPGQRGQPQDWITIALGGREGGCWQPMNDIPLVLAAMSNVETHFNVNIKRVILGGYSSGGDLGYPTVFLNAGLFAGILIENSDPFDNGYDANTLLAAASWKVNVVHLTHLQDTTYPIDRVRGELGTVQAAGFPVTLIERVGSHYDDAGATVAGQSVPGTTADLQSILLPYIDRGWSAP